MAVSIGSIVLHVSNIDRARTFWKEALNYVPQSGNPDLLVPESGEGPRLHLDETDRTHLDVFADREGSDQQKEVERLMALGARRVDWEYPPEPDFVVLADTEGNLFCVIE